MNKTILALVVGISLISTVLVKAALHTRVLEKQAEINAIYKELVDCEKFFPKGSSALDILKIATKLALGLKKGFLCIKLFNDFRKAQSEIIRLKMEHNML